MGRWTPAVAVWLALWPRLAAADCPLLPDPGVACDVTGDCHVPWRGEGVPTLVQSDGTRHSATVITAMRERAVATFAGPLAAGEYMLESSNGDRGPVVRVAPRDRTFPHQTLAGQTVPNTYECREVTPLDIPVLRTEELFHLTVDIGRNWLPGARATVWVLGEGVPVPSGNTAPNARPTESPWGDRLEPFAVASAAEFRDFGLLIPRNQLTTGDRVAVQVIEPTGSMTNVLVVTVDRAEKYMGCQCASPSNQPSLLAMVMLLAALRLRKVKHRLDGVSV